MGVDFFCNDDHKRSFCVCWCTVLLSKLFGEISIMRYTSLVCAEELNMRIMGLDYGSKTVGVAVCDPLGITAQAVETITRKDENKLRQTLARIEALAKEYGVEKFVLGYPKNMNNTVGDRAQKSEELKAALERRTGLPVELWDERLTTVAAERVLMESGVRREHRKESVDRSQQQ